MAEQPLAQTTEITARDVHPPLYQWMLHRWVRLAGIGEFAIRLPSVFAGVLTVAAAYPLTRRLGGSRRAAWLASFFLALSAFHIRWSQQTRMYALAALWVALAAYASIRAGPRRPGWWALLILAGAARAEGVQVPEKYAALYHDKVKDERLCPYYGALTCMDESIGEVLALIREQGQEANTFVVFLSDNRGAGNGGNAPLRVSKAAMYEGGIRVPFVARWPGRLPARRVCDDFLST